MLKRIPLLWFILIVVTVASYVLAGQSTSPIIVGLIMGLAAAKGYLIVDGFMELNGLKHFIRYAMILYCPVMGLLVWLLATA